MTTPLAIKRALTRFYSDNRQLSAIVIWADGSATYGKARKPLEPIGLHVQALFDRAKRDGLTIEHEVW